MWTRVLTFLVDFFLSPKQHLSTLGYCAYNFLSYYTKMQCYKLDIFVNMPIECTWFEILALGSRLPRPRLRWSAPRTRPWTPWPRKVGKRLKRSSAKVGFGSSVRKVNAKSLRGHIATVSVKSNTQHFLKVIIIWTSDVFTFTELFVLIFHRAE